MKLLQQWLLCIYLFLINFVVCQMCPTRYGDRCESCSSQSICVKCKVGFWNVTLDCAYTCVTSLCTCTKHWECLSCKDGHYAKEKGCNRTCPSECNGQPCNNDGTCLCKPNFTGNTCDSCVDGMYGANCSMQCSRGCEGSSCSPIDGSCNCSKYYYGKTCENCIAGRYGEECSKPCSIGCLERTCTPTAGKCVCNDFYTGDKCDVCEDGRYGDGCLNASELNHPDEKDNFQTVAITGGVIGVIVVIMAVVAITVIVKRRLSQKEAQDYGNQREATAPVGNATQPGPYETLNTSQMEKNDRRDTYTNLVTTGQAGMKKGSSAKRSTLDHLNVVGSEKDKSGPYEILNTNVFIENERSDTYKSIFTTEQAGGKETTTKVKTT